MLGILLAGGQNTRFPYLKGFIEIGGRPIIEGTLERLAEVTDEVAISTNTPDPYYRYGVRLVGDTFGHAGPMSGIVSVMQEMDVKEAMVVACDMPFISKELMRHIISHRDKQATVPVFNGRPEPLVAVYTRAAAESMRALIVESRTSLRDMLAELDVHLIEEDEVRALDPDGRSFININTIEDLEGLARVEQGG